MQHRLKPVVDKIVGAIPTVCLNNVLWAVNCLWDGGVPLGFVKEIKEIKLAAVEASEPGKQGCQFATSPCKSSTTALLCRLWSFLAFDSAQEMSE